MSGGDLLLVNARLVFAEGEEVHGGLTCRDGVITTVFAGDPPPGSFDGEVLDAGGRPVLPGLIDPHVQLYPADDYAHYATETGSAALGGVTTIIKMHRDLEGYPDDAFAAEVAGAERRAHVDFCFHVAVMTDAQIAAIGHYAEALEVSSFKLFMAYKGEEGRRIGIQGVDDGQLHDAFRAVAAAGGVALVHCENQDLAQRALDAVRAAGEDGLRAFERSRPAIVEAEAVRRAAFLAAEAGCELYVVHVTSRHSLGHLAALKAGGARLHLETEPHYLTETADTPAGTLAKVIPPIREQADADALWDALASGALDTIGSDHVAATRARKKGSVWDAQLAFPGIATILPVLLSEGVHRRGLPLSRIASVTSTAPARIFGLRAKGELRPGRDADLVVVDLDAVRTVDAADLGSTSDFSIYEGRELRGWPVATVSRGRVVMRDGELTGPEGWGRFVRRPARTGAAA
ncbi:amidohydrolase family protein [Baekduia soli]|uniref:Amidohydrolase family protein n=1 Tax=Baekduia soli TaxID=496014 RepID=A0A5B8U5J3_9ACTN|nr:amidohydrolase family protein [Baekduia soli]QEC48353.1 amidohydrolase family protein [Baekduia soli]